MTEIQKIKLGGYVGEEVQKINDNFDALNGAIPTKTSDLTNDSNFATAQDVADAVGEITVPTKTSDLTNDSNFVKTTDTDFVNKVDKEEGKCLSEENYTAAEKNKLSALSAPTEKAILTSDWTTSNGQHVCTLAMSGKKPGVVMRKNGTEYGAVIVDVKLSGSNVVITSDEAFEGYIICI